MEKVPFDDNSFSLKPLKKFLEERGNPLDDCNNCYRIKKNCDCGKKVPFRGKEDCKFTVTKLETLPSYHIFPPYVYYANHATLDEVDNNRMTSEDKENDEECTLSASERALINVIGSERNTKI